MSAPVDAVELRRAVWRHEHGYLSGERVRIEWLDEEYRRALAAFEALAGDRATVRAHAPALLQAHEDARRRAERALYADDALRTGLDQLLRCRELMERVRTLVLADAALGLAAEAVRRLHACVRDPRLRALPCVDAPARLLDAARDRMRDGHYARTVYLAGVCRHQAAALLSDAPADPGRAAAVRAALEELRDLCTATRVLLRDAADDPCRAETLDAAAALVEDGGLVLAEQVAEELVALLVPRLRFHRELQREADAEAVLAELRRRLAGAPPDEDPWTEAVRILWQMRADDGLRRIRKQQAHLGRFDTGAAEDGLPGEGLRFNDSISNRGTPDEQPDL